MNLVRSIPRLAGLAGALASLNPDPAHAQGGTPMLVVRVRAVEEETGVPVAGAEVSIVRGLRAVVAQEVTDEAGRRQFTVRNDTLPYQVVVRKIGFRRSDRFFPTGYRDTITVNVVMTRIATTLEAVQVTAREDPARKAYYIDDEEIAASERPLFTSADIIEKLRPDMLYGHGGPTVCGKVSSVFVNGRRIIQAPVAGIEASRARLAPPSASGLRNARGARVDLDKYKVTGMVGAILAMIKPEHVAEMTYNDCFEKSVKVNRGANAVFVILKPGIGYSMEDGSYVIDVAAPKAAAARAAGGAAATPAPAPGGAPSGAPATAAAPAAQPGLASWRIRILGVFDSESGDMIEGAEVVDVASGTKALTTRTGTVSLAFLPEGSSEVRVQKAGYRPLSIEVLISPRDTVPITITLAKNK